MKDYLYCSMVWPFMDNFPTMPLEKPAIKNEIDDLMWHEHLNIEEDENDR